MNSGKELIYENYQSELVILMTQAFM